MAEYRAMLHQIHPYPVKQYVIYLGRSRSAIPYKINLPNFKYEYSLINFKELPHEIFLSSNEPEEQILAILANLGNKTPSEVIKAVLQKIAKTSPEGVINNKYFEQLRVIMQLRNFDKQIDPTMLNVNSFWKKERDILYKWGRQDGRHEEALEIARELKKEGLSIEFIAKTTKLSVKEIEAL